MSQNPFYQIWCDARRSLPPNCGVAYHHTKNRGKAHRLVGGGYLLQIPRPKTPLSLGIAFHEMAHVLCGHLDDDYPNPVTFEDFSRRFDHEVEACEFAVKLLREYGVETGPLNELQTEYLETLAAKLEVMEKVCGSSC